MYLHPTSFMTRQIILKVTRIQRRKQLKRFLICSIVLLHISHILIAQEVPVPESVKTFPNAKCYWGYSVERVSTTHDSVHKYIIRVSIVQEDSVGNNKGSLRVKHALIYCSFLEKGITKTIYCKPKGSLWVAKFKISTNQPLPLKLIANYNHQLTTMPLTLNEGTYPGEPDHSSEEKL